MRLRLPRLLLALAAAAWAVSACGDPGSQNIAGSEPASAPEPDTAEAAEPSTTARNVVDDIGEGDLLRKVQERGRLVCGVSGTRVIFSETQPDGSVFGVDADYCRVVAAVLFGDASAVEFVSLTTAERFAALQSGHIDVLIRSTTWTQSRDVAVGVDFGPVIYYDGQQLMARGHPRLFVLLPCGRHRWRRGMRPSRDDDGEERLRCCRRRRDRHNAHHSRGLRRHHRELHPGCLRCGHSRRIGVGGAQGEAAARRPGVGSSSRPPRSPRNRSLRCTSRTSRASATS